MFYTIKAPNYSYQVRFYLFWVITNSPTAFNDNENEYTKRIIQRLGVQRSGIDIILFAINHPGDHLRSTI